MSCLSWNCRGLGNPQTEDELVALVGNKDPKLVFLMETKVEKVALEQVGKKIQKTNIFVVPRHNIGGGLAMLKLCIHQNALKNFEMTICSRH